MDHQKIIAYQRIFNLRSGIEKVYQFIGNANEMLGDERIEREKVQDKLEEIQEFLQWLAGQ